MPRKASHYFGDPLPDFTEEEIRHFMETRGSTRGLLAWKPLPRTPAGDPRALLVIKYKRDRPNLLVQEIRKYAQEAGHYVRGEWKVTGPGVTIDRTAVVSDLELLGLIEEFPDLALDNPRRPPTPDRPLYFNWYIDGQYSTDEGGTIYSADTPTGSLHVWWSYQKQCHQARFISDGPGENPSIPTLGRSWPDCEQLLRGAQILAEDWYAENFPLQILAALKKNPKHRDRLPGGLADNMQPEDFDPDQLRRGIKVEMEHTNDPDIAREIAMDHLAETPDYYTWHRAMEVMQEREKAKRNPKEQATAEVRSRYQKAKVLAEKGVPGEREAARAAIARMEERYYDLRPRRSGPSEAQIARMEQEKRRREARQAAKMQGERFATLTAAAERSLISAYGGPTRWRLFDTDRRAEHIQEALAAWMGGPGLARGLMLDGGLIGDLGTNKAAVKSRQPSATELLNEFRVIANAIRSANADEDKTYGLGEFAGDEPDSESPRFGEEREDAVESASNVRDVLLARLKQLEALGADRTQLALVRMHAGVQVVPSQPRALLGELPLYHMVGQRRDNTGRLMQKHPVGAGGSCPTCKRIARFVRVPGLSPRQVSNIIDELVFVQLPKLTTA